MTEDETVEQVEQVEQTDQVEKEARVYSQEYIRELIAESKKYMPPTVWDHLHRKARSTAGGRVSGKSKREAAEAANTPDEGMIAPELEGQLQEAQAEPTKKAADDCEVAAQKCEAMKAKAAKSTTEKADNKEEVMKPYPSEHACRLKQPGDFETNSFRRMERDMEGKKYSIITGKLTGESTMTEQAYRYPKDTWDTAAAKAHCSAHKGASFELAVADVAKSDRIEPFVGTQPLISFVAASPGIIESVRKEALVGTTGRIFNEQYLKPLGLKRDDIAILYLVPRLLKSEDDKVREPTLDEITAEEQWYTTELIKASERSEASGLRVPIKVALGHTVKKSMGRAIDITLPHPNALHTKRTQEELLRKMMQLEKMLTARGSKTHLNTAQENL